MGQNGEQVRTVHVTAEPAPQALGGDQGLRVCMLVSGLMFGGGQRVVLDLLAKAREMAGIEGRLILLGGREPAVTRHAAVIVPYDGRYNQPSVLFATSR